MALDWPRQLASALFVLITVVFAVARANTPEPTAPPEPAQNIVLQLQWKHQFEFAGFYAAKAKGYYRQAGLNVEIREYESGENVADEVISRRADFGISDSSLVTERAKGKPVLLLANILKHSPMVLLSHADSGITSPAQMVGKRLMLVGHEVENAAIISMLREESVTLDQLHLLHHTFDLQDFIDRKTDIISAYATNEPGQLKERGIAFNVIAPINYGVDFYSNTLFTSEAMAASRPDLTKRFVDASLRGWEYALANPDEIIDLILAKYNTQQKSRAALEYEASALRRYIVQEHLPLGSISPRRLVRITDVYRELGMLERSFDVTQMLWQPDTEEGAPIPLTEEEKTWLKQNGSIVVGVDPAWAPFEFIDKQGAYRGMAADFIRLIAERLQTDISVQDNATWADVISSARNGRLDALPAAMSSEQRREFLSFTSPHIVYPMVIVTAKDSAFISGLDDIGDRTVAVVDGYVTEDLMRANHPDLSLLTAPDLKAALTMVANGDAYAVIDNLASVSYAVETLGITNLRISGTTPYNFELGIAVPKHKKVLLGILQKGIDSLSKAEIDAIRHRWITIETKPVTDMTALLKLAGVALLIIFVVLLWNHRLMREVRQRKLVESRLIDSERRFRVLFEDNRAVELIIDPADGAIVAANQAAQEFYGYDMASICRMNISDINTLPPDEIQLEMQRAQKHERDFFEFKHRLASGDIRDVRVHSSPVMWKDRELLFSIIHDITHEKILQEELNRQARKLSYQATHDPLTGLVNRREFEHRLTQLVNRGASGNTHALMYMDLDQFKIVNDTCGHHAGDELLKQIATVISDCLRKSDLLARLGGDEFGVIVETCSLQQARDIADNMRQAIAAFQFSWQQHVFRIGSSIGVVMISDRDTDASDLLKHADAACYGAKDRGRNRVQVYAFDDHLLQHPQGEISWITRLQQAIDDERLVLFAQAIVPLKPDKGLICSYELLLRLRDTDGTLIPPGAFLPAAERYGLMIDIDKQVVSLALRQLRQAPSFLSHVDYVSINLSGHSLSDKPFRTALIALLADYDDITEKICFEITETAAITNLSQATRFMSILQSLGVRFALDDFGSGLSSFGYLKNLPVDFLKIDGMFVKNINNDPLDQAIIKSIHEVGTVLGKRTIAEFIEDQETLATLRKIGITYGQGYGLGQPLPLSEAMAKHSPVNTPTPPRHRSPPTTHLSRRVGSS